MSTKRKAITFYADEATAAWYDALPDSQARSQVINRMIALGRQFEDEGAMLPTGVEDRLQSIEEWIAWASGELMKFRKLEDPSDKVVSVVRPPDYATWPFGDNELSNAFGATSGMTQMQPKTASSLLAELAAQTLRDKHAAPAHTLYVNKPIDKPPLFDRFGAHSKGCPHRPNDNDCPICFP